MTYIEILELLHVEHPYTETAARQHLHSVLPQKQCAMQTYTLPTDLRNTHLAGDPVGTDRHAPALAAPTAPRKRHTQP